MKAKITLTLAIIAALVSLDNSVNAQSTSQPQPGSFTLRGDSLVNINHRSAQDDFGQFFNQQNSRNISNNQGQESTISEKLPLSESISIPATYIFLQPATQNINGNDGLQVQLDLSDDQ
jgi:hypothetical protein